MLASEVIGVLGEPAPILYIDEYGPDPWFTGGGSTALGSCTNPGPTLNLPVCDENSSLKWRVLPSDFFFREDDVFRRVGGDGGHDGDGDRCAEVGAEWNWLVGVIMGAWPGKK
jgi:hypothetical protein